MLARIKVKLLIRLLKMSLKNFLVSPYTLINHSLKVNSQVEEMKSLLDTESRGTLCMLGIYRDVKIGKIFATELYNEIIHQFEAAIFLSVKN